MIRYCTGPSRRPSEKEAVVPFSQLTTSIRRASVSHWLVGRSINDQFAACDLRRCVFIAHGCCVCTSAVREPSRFTRCAWLLRHRCSRQSGSIHVCVDCGFVCAGMAFGPDLFCGAVLRQSILEYDTTAAFLLHEATLSTSCRVLNSCTNGTIGQELSIIFQAYIEAGTATNTALWSLASSV